MSAETKNIEETPNIASMETPKEKPIIKRNIVHFAADNPMAINFDHVSIMSCNGKTIDFHFYTKMLPVDFIDEETAKSVFNSLLTRWSADVE